MSSGEKRRKKADKSLRILLELKAGDETNTPGHDPHYDTLMARLVRELTGEEPPPPPKLEVAWVENEQYAAAREALKNAARLAERGLRAITPEDLEHHLRNLLPSTSEREGPFFEVAFEQYLKTKDVKPETLKGYEETGRLFRRFIKRRHVHKISGLDIQNFIDSFKHEGKAQRTRQKHLNCLRSFFRWARDVAKYIQEEPTAGIKVRVLRSQRKKRRKGLTFDEARKLLAACRKKRKQKRHDIQHVWMASFISLRTGLRRENVLGLHWSQVDLENGTIHVPASEYKTDRAEDLEIPIHEELWRVLRLWKVTRKKSPLVSHPHFVLGRRVRDIKVPLSGAAKRARVDTDFHNLRHAFETWLVDHDVPSPAQKALLGHSPGSVTEGYAHPSLEKMRECVNRLPRLLERESSRDPDGV